jgi:hypothetical protein
MTKGELLEALLPFSDDILITTRTVNDGSDSEKSFFRIEYHWEHETQARAILIQDLSIVGYKLVRE